jgi:hypothetical protein
VVNCTLLPKPLRPKIWQRIALVFGAVFFLSIGGMATYAESGKLMAKIQETFGSAADTTEVAQ